MLMGLLAKNAILDCRVCWTDPHGYEASHGCRFWVLVPFPTDLNDSLAMIVGLIPVLMLASGVGAHGNRTFGSFGYWWYVDWYDF